MWYVVYAEREGALEWRAGYVTKEEAQTQAAHDEENGLVIKEIVEETDG